MLNDLVQQLKEKGYRITPQRRAILERILQTAKNLTAAEIWREVRHQYPDVGLDTIYRNLNILVEMGLLIPIVGLGKNGTRYEVASSSRHHHHITCIKCGEAACLEFCPIDPEFLIMLRQHGYELVRHNIELFGLCAQCRQG
ncbi:ferric uptake regulator, Fur family [Thermosinus carboxydivorans Nor1]|uniref:Ferric uptake regulator, Fur family n=1 Tax=Thermosinus carboxydivorans Nor1 TaxID=401526 RepID=A1HQ50_9FIRM|nr:Fur family transcriptional regulator [Thermosinus carboxydivorans]EAX47940.1 ferric uptake regulator, Fur family [Thermosinus carboxydivorans Nor1]